MKKYIIHEDFEAGNIYYLADEVDAEIARFEAKLEKAKEALSKINTKEALKASGGIEVMAWIFRLEQIAKKALEELEKV